MASKQKRHGRKSTGRKAVSGKRESTVPEANGRLGGALFVALLAVLVALLALGYRSGRRVANEDDSEYAFLEEVAQRSVGPQDKKSDKKSPKVELPEVTGMDLKYASAVDTLGFASFVNSTESNDTLSLISFFDPRSKSYMVLQDQIEKTAKMIGADLALAQEGVRVGMVNCAVDTYLQVQYAAEMQSSWQEAEADSSESFKFGRPNYFPMITKLFRSGVPVEEYTGVVSPDEIKKYVYRHLAPNCSEIVTHEELGDFVTGRSPAFLGCFPDDEVVNLASSCRFEAEMFTNLTRELHGWAYFARVRNVELCAKLKGDVASEGLSPCSIAALRDGGTHFARFDRRVETLEEEDEGADKSVVVDVADPKANQPDAEGDAKPSDGAVLTPMQRNKKRKKAYTVALGKFLKANRDPLLIEMTPDNSWEIIEQNNHLIIALVDPTAPSSKAEIESVLSLAVRDSRLSRRPQDNNASSSTSTDSTDADIVMIKYVWSDGLVFGDQFALGPEDLPSLVHYDVDTDKDSTYGRLPKVAPNIPGAQDPSVAPLVGGNDLDGTALSVADWIVNRTKLLSGIGDGGAKNDTDVALKQETAKRDAEKKKQEDERREKLLEEHHKHARTLPWHEQSAISDGDYADVSAEAAWEYMRSLATEYCEFRTAYDEMSPEEQRINVALEAELRSVKRIFDDPPFREYAAVSSLAKHGRSLPCTPIELKVRLQDPAKRKVLKETIELLDAHKVLWTKRWKGHGSDDGIDAAIKNKNIKPFTNTTKRKWGSAVKRGERALHQLVSRVEEEFVANRVGGGEGPTVRDIERRHHEGLSVEEFVERYAKRKKPVIITGLRLSKTPWTNEHIKEKCGAKYVPLNIKDPSTTNWGGLVKVKERVNLTEFIDTYNINKTRRQWYLHDWSLPRSCPEIMGPPPYDEFTYPKYFAGDYFQRMPFVGYQHTWPSLFVGANGTESKMHVDSGGTNFWLYLIAGKKEWRFFDRNEKLNLYPMVGSAHYHFDVFRPDLNKYPLFGKTTMYQGIQEPGELHVTHPFHFICFQCRFSLTLMDDANVCHSVYIPAGCPHAVRNLEDITGLSMNYLDASNQFLYLWLQLMEEDYRDFELYADPKFPSGLRKNQTELTLGEFKSQRWYKLRGELDLF